MLHKPYTLRALADCLDRFAPAEKRTSSDSIPVSGPETLRAEETKAEEIAPPAAAALAQDDDCLDRETIRELSAVARDAAGGFLSRVFGLYYENAPKCLAEIERAAQARDDVAISRAAHAVKSMSYNVGARKVVTIAANLEERANLRGASVANDDIEALARALDEACKALRRLEEEAAADPPKCATLPQSGDLLTPRHLFYK
ncbi:MAG: Hpt domain-containing protein [Methylocystis sp.]|nr:Hpt domain-containing protein [Methylocystis sp.]